MITEKYLADAKRFFYVNIYVVSKTEKDVHWGDQLSAVTFLEGGSDKKLAFYVLNNSKKKDFRRFY